MIRNQRFWVAVAAFVFLSAVAASIILYFSRSESTVRIIQDGKVVTAFELEGHPDEELVFEYEGRKNIVEIKDGRLRMRSADCPDKLCERSGWRGKGSLPLICLPNRLVIEFTASDTDAVAR